MAAIDQNNTSMDVGSTFWRMMTASSKKRTNWTTPPGCRPMNPTMRPNADPDLVASPDPPGADPAC